MPSPFPGMDPYLEGVLWPTFHVQFAVQIARELSPLVLPKYVAMTQKYQLPGVSSDMGVGHAVEIRDTANRSLVTVIEVMSPVTKMDLGRREYLRKRDRILASRAHLLEIDLLRRGRRVPTEEELPYGAYFVFLSRADRRPLVDVWPIPLEEKLPVVPVPLANGDADVPLDLQKVFGDVYDSFGFAYSIKYQAPLEHPLMEPQTQWADQLLRDAGRQP